MNIEKLTAFYQTDLGHHVKTILNDKLFDPSLMQGKTTICSVGAHPVYKSKKILDGKIFFQNYPASSLPEKKMDGDLVQCSREAWPYRAESIDQVIMVHDLEFIDEIDSYLRESWRVLKGEGRMVMAIPNRQSRWTRSDETPFGYGRLCHLKSIRKSLEKNHFCIDKTTQCLFFPPYAPKTRIGQLVQSTMDLTGEYIGLRGGVYILDVSKHVYAPIKGLKERVTAPAQSLINPQRPKAVGKNQSQ